MSLDKLPIRRALLSVSEKTGLVELGRELAAADVALVATGSTAQTLRAAGLEVQEVSELTGFPECLGGRVKTLHPAVHAGILANLSLPEHVNQLDDLGIVPFDLVVCNLYPFVKVTQGGANWDTAIENIDIGGPTIVRAAAKNHNSVSILTDPAQYSDFVSALHRGYTTFVERKRWAVAAYQAIADYDVAIAMWLSKNEFSADAAGRGACCAEAGDDQQPLGQDANTDAGRSGESTPGVFTAPQWLGFTYRLTSGLRYGENPHQGAGAYAQVSPPVDAGLSGAKQLNGKEVSFNNLQDTNAALRAAFDHEAPTVAIIKHMNPCGIASKQSLSEAYTAAFECDPLSAFGGVVAANRPVDAATAEKIAHVFTEVVAAPAFTPEAFQILSQKENLRLLEVGEFAVSSLEFRQIEGGLIAQQPDLLDASGQKDGKVFGDDPQNWTLVAGEAASSTQLQDLRFAWRSCRAVKSNAILLAKDQATIGVGMGQVNRVDSAKLAVERANTLADGQNRTMGAVAASDAFFPFPDGLQVLIDAGVTAVVAPGGSIRDDQVIEAAQQAGITVYFTGTRHFLH